ncbi:ABI family, member 3a isoform X2 [Lepisosteus oculatus]|uniref:ABI family, member 3a isoform X2 n=1 Tax=Lepisosteus oculatus TaxID=7918 RepID=UPI00371C5700
MKDQNGEEIQTILQEAPSARQALLDNYANLHKVADYCESNYLQVEDTKKALEETKAFTTQSLASVAYQISTMASNVLKLLDAQTAQLRSLESSVNLISQTVDMHREKVSRREIGVFTTVKRMPRNQKIIPPPATPEQKTKYSRTPIAYATLDSVGHGMKDSSKQLGRTGTMNRKQPSREPGGTLGRSTRAPEAVQCPVAPSLTRGPSLSSLNERPSASSFGIAVPPPVIPTWTVPDVPPPLMEENPPPPAPLDIPAPPPPPPACIPAPHAPTSVPPPPPAPLLEMVAEENGFPPPLMSNAPPPPPVTDAFDLPAPPPLPGNGLNSEMDFQPPPPPLDMFGAYEDSVPPLPPPVDYDLNAPPSYEEKAVALYSYSSSKEDELTFQEGDIIYIIQKGTDGWYTGFFNGVEGYFPGNYVGPAS